MENSDDWYDCQLPDRTRLKIVITVNGATRVLDREKKKDKAKPVAKG